MDNPLIVLLIAFLLAFLVESLTEFVFGKPFDKVPALAPHKWLLMYIALLVGVGVCFFYRLDIVALLAQYAGAPTFAAVTWLGMLLTGMAVGRGSNYLHDLVMRFFVKPTTPAELPAARPVSEDGR